jgi:hypothetical protein
MSDVAHNGKTTGGITGKGFKPGKSGNPSGRPKALFHFGEYVRTFLYSPAVDGTAKTQLDALIQRLAKEKPEVLLHSGFGKPVESHEISGLSAAPVIKLRHAHEISEERG